MIVKRAKNGQLKKRELEGNNMKDDHAKLKEKSICIVKYSPVPDYVTCPDCGFEIELWSGKYETQCLNCGLKVFSKETTVH